VTSVFETGSTVGRCDVRDGMVWTAAPYRVLAGDCTRLVLATWPGVADYTLGSWIRSLAGGEQARRYITIAVTVLAPGSPR
jgi:hypothetical protein